VPSRSSLLRVSRTFVAVGASFPVLADTLRSAGVPHPSFALELTYGFSHSLETEAGSVPTHKQNGQPKRAGRSHFREESLPSSSPDAPTATPGS
jgi:hypothetical protein